jgi:hypothetical protein
MKRTLSAAIVGVILAAFGVLSAHAQDLKAMLLKPAKASRENNLTNTGG